jgi:hypothetical protein
MKFLNIIAILIYFIIFQGLINLQAQNLSFTQPVNFLPAASTDKAIDITNFKGNYFVTWKDAGATGHIHVCHLGQQYSTRFSADEATAGEEQSAFAPVLRVVNDHIYALWLGTDGSLKYIINNSDTSFNTTAIHTVSFENLARLKSGITATVVNGKMAVASHADNKNDMVIAVIDADNDGLLKPAVLQVVTGKKSAEYPFVVTLSNNTIRICYKNSGDQGIYYTDFDSGSNTWSNDTRVSNSKTQVSPAVYHAFNTARLFYIWKGNKQDNHIYYGTQEEQVHPTNQRALPDYFATANPVSICSVDEKKFILAFVGIDKKLYLSYFTNYNPARWMEDLVFPAKGDRTLKDIVIPGSHDAGMSALNGTGGAQAGSINPCNTLTQTQNIGRQLNEGIRMFDLRVGTFKKQIYIKHSSSDCMADAIGGGYGERFKDIMDSLKTFLSRHKKEFVILTFSHFCPTEASAKSVADSIVTMLGKDLIYNNKSKSIDQIKLNELSGKVLVAFEKYSYPDMMIDSNSMGDAGKTFLNFRRKYAATNQINTLVAAQEQFFTSMKDGVAKNDLIRLDWQLTQTSQEAALVCNDFQNEDVNPVINSVMLLTNVINKNQSITDLAIAGNKYITIKVNEWISAGVINKKNKPNILYVDAAGAWITDYCIRLNDRPVYN